MRTSSLVSAYWLCAVLLLSALLGAAPAAARPGHIGGLARFDAHVGLGWEGSVGPGFRVDFPLARDGLLRSANDELALTLGVDLLFYTLDRYDYHYPRVYVYEPHHHHAREWDYRHEHHRRGDVTLLFPIALQWNFILRHHWTVFPEAGVAIEQHDSHAHVLPDLGAGARWHFAGGQAALLFRLTYPGALQLGIAW